MTKATQTLDQVVASKDLPKEHNGSRDETYMYKDSGIRERHGAVPLWLQLVSYGLILWGIYYTIRYWSNG